MFVGQSNPQTPTKNAPEPSESNPLRPTKRESATKTSSREEIGSENDRRTIFLSLIQHLDRYSAQKRRMKNSKARAPQRIRWRSSSSRSSRSSRTNEERDTRPTWVSSGSRAHAASPRPPVRTARRKRNNFPVGNTPPTSDIYLYIYVHYARIAQGAFAHLLNTLRARGVPWSSLGGGPLGSPGRAQSFRGGQASQVYFW